jgi:ribosomal protein L37AE/L43A
MNAPATIEPQDIAPTLATVLRHVELVEQVLHKVMKEGAHYGASFPGDTKKNLLKPGADKLCLAFQLSPSFVVEERALPGEHREYRVTCRLALPSGRVMGEGLGTCSTMESKYRWRNSRAKCPECQKETVIKTSRGYWCPPDKGGCGANPAASAIEGQVRGKVENPDIADVFNTCLKIGKKRAYVDATITATAASDLFTQDLEDIQANAQAAEKEAAERHAQRAEQTAAAAPPIQPQQQAKPAAPAPTATGGDPMQAAYRAVQSALGVKAATRVWQAHKASEQRDERLRVLTTIGEACQRIVAVLGGDAGGQLIQDEVDAHGNDQMTPDQVKSLVDRLVKQSHGEVLP